MTANDDDERDGLDIQSLSVVEAEFFYNKTDEGKSAADIAATKRTINLDAFHIIKVIGKGNYCHLISLFYSFCVLFLPDIYIFCCTSITGSFGKVFLVRDKANQTLHALKVKKSAYPPP